MPFTIFKNDTKLSKLCKSHANNLNLIRFLAAISVIFSHSYPLSLGASAGEPLQKDFGFTTGELAVDIFFIISGFLITQSATFRKDWRSFAKSRILRIYPALLLVVITCTFIIGPLYTGLTLTDYMMDLRTYSYFIKDSILISGFKSAPPLVFENNPLPLGMNGSLWTLPWELKMYLLLGFLAYVTRRYLTVGIFFIASISSLVFAFATLNHITDEISPFFRFATFFFLGASAFLLKDRISISLKIALPIIAIFVLLFFINKTLLSTFYIIALPYTVLYLAYTSHRITLCFNKVGDYSYGLYIWAFPIQQMLAYHFIGIKPLEMFVYTVLLTLPVAILSYHYLEKKALKLKT